MVKEAVGIIDTCPFWDDDGKAYIVHGYANSRCGIKSHLAICEMTWDGTKAISEDKIIFNGKMCIRDRFINELRSAKFKKVVQTISYLPHFVSVAAICGMLTLFLSSQQTLAETGNFNNEGIINQILLKMGVIKQGIPFLDRTEWFRTVYIASDVWASIGWSAIVYIAACLLYTSRCV